MIGRPTQVLLASGSRTAQTNSDLQNYAAGQRGAMFFLDVSLAASSGNIEVQIEAQDPISGGYLTFTDFAPVAVPVVASGEHFTTMLVVYPSEAGTYTVGTVQHHAGSLPTLWRAKLTPFGTFTCSLAAQMLP